MEKSVSSPPQLAGQIAVPPDKSISHRAAILNAIAAGQATVENFLTAEDTLSTLACLRALSVDWSLEPASEAAAQLTIEGRGLDGLSESTDVLNAGNSGTTMRLLAGLLSGRSFLSILTGDESLRRRPMARIIQPLRQMGAQVFGRVDDSMAPLVLSGGRLHGITYRSPIASAQVKSAVLLAALQAEDDTVYSEPTRSRDHTERLLGAMGAGLLGAGDVLRVSPLTKDLTPLSLRVPGDFSAAAFWLVAAVTHPNADLTLTGVGLNPTRCGLLEVLKEMGADIVVSERHEVAGEPVGDVRARSSNLCGVEVEGRNVVRLIDEVPVLAVAAAVAEGRTNISDVGELRFKESDRVRLTVLELRRLGAQINEDTDALVIEGTSKLTGAVCESHGDHRLAMALAVAGLVAEGETVVAGAEATDISYPGFWQSLENLRGHG